MYCGGLTMEERPFAISCVNGGTSVPKDRPPKRKITMLTFLIPQLLSSASFPTSVATGFPHLLIICELHNFSTNDLNNYARMPPPVPGLSFCDVWMP